jgi:hypothetical protein
VIGARECQVCNRKAVEFQHCPKCQFYACKQCVGMTVNNAMEVEAAVEDPEREPGGKMVEEAVEEDSMVGEL